MCNLRAYSLDRVGRSVAGSGVDGSESSGNVLVRCRRVHVDRLRLQILRSLMRKKNELMLGKSQIYMLFVKRRFTKATLGTDFCKK